MRKTSAGTAVRRHRGVALAAAWQEWIVEPRAARNLPGAAVPPEKTHPSHQEIAKLAYAIWEERGCPFGSPEADWLRAEQELRQRQRAD